MKKLYSCLIVLCTVLLMNKTSQAQVSQGGTPQSFDPKLSQTLSSLPTEVMPYVNVDALRAEDLIVDKNKDIPWRFGQNLDVSFNTANSGVWDILPNGDKLWRLRIYSAGATSINLTFDAYRLPAGAKLFVYNDDHTDLIGAFTDFNNRDDKAFATTLVKGDAITLEYYEPVNAAFTVELSIRIVTHGYRGVKEFAEKSFGSAGSCEINVHCPTGIGWENEIRSVCMLVTGGSGFCSGALVNNTANDGTPYVLTANHCYSTPSSWVFWFNWEAPTCTQPTSSPSYNSISGATLKARNVGSDFCLVQMSSAPLANYNVYYAGWSRDTVHPTSGMGIHHPSGDIKKISQAGLFSRADGIDEGNGAADCWQVLWPTAACTEPGSSGSPIFNASHKLIGQLYGGPSACGASQMWDYYGRFYVSWTGGGTSATRLSDWLDPVSLNPATVEGYDPNGPSRPTVNFSADVTSSCLGTISFTDQSSNLPNGWHWDFGDMTTSTLQNPQHLYTANGTYTVQLIATNTIGSDTLTKTSYITINMPAAPSVAGDSVCNSGVCVLNATGSGILKWYSDQTGINLIGTGPTYTTPTLSTTTNYWVSDSVLSPTQSGGKPNNTGGGADLTNQNQYEIFDCYTPITLVSVDVYASVTGIRTFELRNSNGTSLQTAAVNITSTTGLFTCPLNFDIPAGTNFQLGLTSGSNCNLYRNNAGISYPYTTPGMFSITTSSASSNPLSYYYYCYHWVVKYHDCVSPLQQVTALVENCTGIGETLSGRVSLSPNPTAGPIYIQLPQQFGAIRSLEIYNCIGQLQKIQSDITLVDISGFNAGLYFLVVTNEKGEKAEAKVVKE